MKIIFELFTKNKDNKEGNNEIDLKELRLEGFYKYKSKLLLI